WVDAICINQNGILEKNKEATRMIGIYENAARVVVWLGPQIDMTAIANMVWYLAIAIWPMLQEYHAQMQRAASRGDPDSMTINALADFFQRKWSTRIWIIQEIASAKEAIIV
ncbi:hypothetical protein K505DRAFT_243860, partial [Melanomma pulvis-pyrius CBS 109.77]